MLFPDFLSKLGNNCGKNMICVPDLCTNRFLDSLSSYNVMTQSNHKLKERDDFASFTLIIIVTRPQQRVLTDLMYSCLPMSIYLSLWLYFNKIEIYNPFMTSICKYSNCRFQCYCFIFSRFMAFNLVWWFPTSWDQRALLVAYPHVSCRP